MKFLKSYAFLFAFATIAYGQNPQPAFRHYSTDHGLPSPEVYDILEDDAGYIWISTDNGVSRFNGYEFESFGPEQGLMNNVVLHLSKGNEGRIWMTTLSGNIYCYQDSVFLFPHNDLVQEQSFQQLGAIHEDQTGKVHISLHDLGILIIQPNGEKELINLTGAGGYLLYEIEGTVLPTFLAKLADKKTLHPKLSTFRRPLIFYQDSIRAVHEIARDHYLTSINRFEGGVLADGYLFFALGGSGFLFKDEMSHWVGSYPHMVISSWQNSEKQIFLGIGNKGGARKYADPSAISKGLFSEILKGYSVSHMMQDQAGGYWFGTNENSIFYTPNLKYKVYHQEVGLSTEYVSSVAIRSETQVYIGLHNGDVYLLNLDNGQLDRIYTEARKNTAVAVFDLKYDPRTDFLWKAGERLTYYDGEKWRDVSSLDPAVKKGRAGWHANKNLSLHATDHLLWGTNAGSGGFAKVNTSNGQIEFSTAERSGRLRERVLKVFQDLQGRVWIGKLDGLFEFKSDTLVRPQNLHPGLHLRVEDIGQMQDSTLVFATKGSGIILWHTDGQFEILSKSEGLTASMIEQVHIDEEQSIWVGTLNGLNKVELAKETKACVTKITIANGLPSNEITDIDSKGDILLIGTTRGLVQLPLSQSSNPVSTSPIIAQLRINGKPANTASVGELPYRQNNLELRVLTINYKLNGRINYRYRLGLTNDWTTTQNRVINFSALAPGAYTFEIQSQNEDGIWSSSQQLSFEILPPFWLTPWFLGVLIMGLLAIGYTLYSYRIQQIQRKTSFDKEVSDLKQMALRAQMNPHFIFNCLNSIQGFIAAGDKAKSTRYLSRFAKLIRVVLDSTQSNLVPLRTETQILENYLELEKMRFQNSFDYQIDVASTINMDRLFIPPLLIQPYVENAILHGLQEDQNNGFIHIQYKLQDEQLFVSLQDNGIGIGQSLSRKKKSSSSHKSIGMSVTHKRLQLLAPASKEDRVVVEDIQDEKGNPAGTIVKLKIKVFESEN